MRAIEIRAFGLDGLALGARPEPEPGRGEIVVRTSAVSLNYRDLMTVLGTYNPKQRLPLVPCSDAVGVVEAIGDGVSRVRVGDRVCTQMTTRWVAGEPTRERIRSTLGGPLDGVLRERLLLSEEAVVQAPSHLSDEEAATLPCAGLTAWSALAGVRAGDTVLVQGTGGVSVFALQLARLLGARVIATTGRAERSGRLLDLGATAVIDYRAHPDWGARVREQTGGAGVDRVIEVGGAGTLEQSLKAVRIGGEIALIGVLDGNAAALQLTSVFMQAVTLRGVLVGPRDEFERMTRALELHEMRPIVDRVYPWLEARTALEALAAGDHFGKICLRF